MKRLWIPIVGLCLAWTAIPPYYAQAQSARTVIGSGGGAADNGAIALQATFGQPSIGHTVSSAGELAQGFWITPEAPRTSHTASPIVVAGEKVRHARIMRTTPNPFSSSADIEVYLPERSQARVQLIDAVGRVAQTLYNGMLEQGAATVSADASTISSGQYTIVLQAGEERSTLPVIIVH